MNTTGQAQFTAYGPNRFPAHLPFAPTGYLFTVPGSFPTDTPSYTDVTNSEMAVYRTKGSWEVRDVNGNRKVWGTGPTRAKAVDTAHAALYRIRHDRAARIADQRVSLGLEPVPPYMVETNHGLDLVLNPAGIGILRRIHDVKVDETRSAAHYLATDLRTGQDVDLPAAGPVQLHPVTVGVLHVRCGHSPHVVAYFENEEDATTYADDVLTRWWPCPDNPSEPTPSEPAPPHHDQNHRPSAPAQIPALRAYDRLTDEYETALEAAQAARTRLRTAGLATIANCVRRHMPTATGLMVRIADRTVIAVFENYTTLWKEGRGEIPGIDDGIDLRLSAFLEDILSLGDSLEVLEEAGWIVGRRGIGLLLPPAP